MITAGIDIGAKNIKVVILKDDKEILAQQSSPMRAMDQKGSAEEAFQAALKKAGLSRDDVQSITATGSSSHALPYANSEVPTVITGARGISFRLPQVRTVIDCGAQDAAAMKCDEKGKVRDMAMNDKCAAGAGDFVETMSRTLEVSREEFGKLSLSSTKSIPMNAQCVIFAESEVVSLIHARTPVEDIAFAVHHAIAERVAALAQRVGIEKEVALIGGLAHNIGFVDCMKKALSIDILVPQDPEYVTALGAALIHN